jgi:hypothetical protein
LMQCWFMVLQVVPLVLLLSCRGSDLLLELTTMSLSVSSIHRTIPLLNGRFEANTYFACKMTMLSSFLTVSRLLFVVGSPFAYNCQFHLNWQTSLHCCGLHLYVRFWHLLVFIFVGNIHNTTCIPKLFLFNFSTAFHLSTMVICYSFSSSYYFTSFPLISQLSLKLGRHYRSCI